MSAQSKRTGLARKLLLGFGSLLGLMVLTAVILSASLLGVTARVARMDGATLPSALHADQIALNTKRIQQNLVQAAAAFTKDNFKLADAAMEDIRKSMAVLQQNPDLSGDAKLRDELKILEADLAKFMVLGKDMADVYMSQGGIDAAGAQLKAFDNAARSLIVRVEGLQKQLVSEATDTMRDISSTLRMVLAMTLILTSLGVLISIAIAVGLHRSVMGAVGGEPDEAAAAARLIAAGNLSQPISSSRPDSLMGQMEAMRNQLRAMIDNLGKEAGRLVSHAAILAESAGRLAQGADQGSTAAASMAATVEQMTASISQVSENTAATNRSVTDTNRLASESGQVVIRLAGGMSSVSKRVIESAAKIEQLGVQSESIRSIVGVIGEIAEQTNLLALNAAIEAARAGESGRGFAVVADEVRKLAERTASSTKDISGKIETIGNSVTEIVSAMGQNVTEVTSGESMAQNAGSAIQSILTGTGDIVRLVGDIDNATRENASASLDVSRHVEEIARLSEQNNQAASDLARTAAEVNAVAKQIGDQLKNFST